MKAEDRKALAAAFDKYRNSAYTTENSAVVQVDFNWFIEQLDLFIELQRKEFYKFMEAYSLAYTSVPKHFDTATESAMRELIKQKEAGNGVD